MTIVGLERLEGGGRNLLVFDPMFHDPSSITRLVGRDFTHRFPDMMLKPYRRGSKYLKKYREFELLKCVLRFSSITCLSLLLSSPTFYPLLRRRTGGQGRADTGVSKQYRLEAPPDGPLAN
jgi:hypothetical protein